MIEVIDLTKRFGRKLAVDNLNFKVTDGEVFGLLGPNGAGKTTTVRMLCSLIRPTSGEAYIDGYSIWVEDDAQRIREMSGLLPEYPGLYDVLTAVENLEFYAMMYGVTKSKAKKRIEELLKMLDLWDCKNEVVGKFSKGMKQKVAIARALIHDPKYVFLDEPTSGLDPEAAKVVRDFIAELSKSGKTIFLCTHNLDEAERLCNKVAIISTRILAIGSPKELSRISFERRIEVKLNEINSRVLKTVSALSFVKSIEAKEPNTLLLTVNEPEKDNPLLIESLVSIGAKIVYVKDVSPRLEEIYLKIVRDKEVIMSNEN